MNMEESQSNIDNDIEPTNSVSVEYTFTFDKDDEKQFRRILDRLDPEEYQTKQEITPIESKNSREHELSTVIVMEPEAASTFRFGMKKLKIKRFRTEQEEAEKKAIEDSNKVVIKVKVDGYEPPAP